VEDVTMKLGLLMEAAQAQQALAAGALERLRDHAGSLDSLVRDEIRATLIEELHALAEDSRRAAEGMRRLQQHVHLKTFVWSVAIVALSTAIPLATVYSIVPSNTDLAFLTRTRDQLRTTVDRLNEQGARAALRRCGVSQRLCVRIDRSAPAYGDGGDYLVIKGY
jgi:hypothetical protein